MFGDYRKMMGRSGERQGGKEQIKKDTEHSYDKQA